MRFSYEGRAATLEFDSESEFTKWVSARLQRAGDRFPGEVETVGAIGPMSVSRIALDTEDEVGAAFEKFKGRFGEDVAALRIPLAPGLSILQLEVRDAETGMVHQWNIAPRPDFDGLDKRAVPGAPKQSARTGGDVDSAEAIAAFGLAYAALGRSRQFSISAEPRAKLKATRKLFAGFCPRCDGLLERTGLRVQERDNQTTLWEERCLDCDERLLGWKKGDGAVPLGWKRM